MEDPQLFSEYGGAYRRLAAQLLDEVWPSLSWPDSPQPVLEVGCGPGILTREVLVPRLPPSTVIVASDVNPAMVKHAKEQNAVPAVKAHEVLDVMDADVTKTAVWQHGPYGKVFGVMVLHWVPDNRRALHNIYKLLAPGGEAVFTLKAYCTMFDVYRYMAKNSRWSKYMKDFDKYITPYQNSKDPACDLRNMLIEEGFEPVIVKAEPRTYVFHSDSETRGAVKSVNAFVSRIPDDEKESYIDDFLEDCYKVKMLTKEKDEKSGQITVFYHYISMVAVARKPQH
ncbi:juvenile hormone acid O-methyltransferase-like [Schistocerca americana]|uniref:juvenile hormone acid O-methyltransferase-like n=1 Tax=Schistocerca americana TaxID=7009 RepID=UPI001F4FA588|nr:juvenile hormone acid O-methyltransferase-like [Schistocerca americana]XP_046990978.1 juvenile hormone acid O-methyltransferase-like [Schistocerca americana]